MRREETENKYKINPIYNSNLKDNDTWKKIGKKTYNLTWSHARKDPIDYQIKGFSFHDFENKIWHSRGDFSLFFRWNFNFKHSLDVEINLDEEEIERFKDWDV